MKWLAVLILLLSLSKGNAQDQKPSVKISKTSHANKRKIKKLFYYYNKGYYEIVTSEIGKVDLNKLSDDNQDIYRIGYKFLSIISDYKKLSKQLGYYTKDRLTRTDSADLCVLYKELQSEISLAKFISIGIPDKIISRMNRKFKVDQDFLTKIPRSYQTYLDSLPDICRDRPPKRKPTILSKPSLEEIANLAMDSIPANENYIEAYARIEYVNGSLVVDFSLFFATSVPGYSVGNYFNNSINRQILILGTAAKSLQQKKPTFIRILGPADAINIGGRTYDGEFGNNLKLDYKDETKRNKSIYVIKGTTITNEILAALRAQDGKNILSQIYPDATFSLSTVDYSKNHLGEQSFIGDQLRKIEFKIIFLDYKDCIAPDAKGQIWILNLKTREVYPEQIH